jgi:hypothetical protein
MSFVLTVTVATLDVELMTSRFKNRTYHTGTGTGHLPCLLGWPLLFRSIRPGWIGYSLLWTSRFHRSRGCPFVSGSNGVYRIGLLGLIARQRYLSQPFYVFFPTAWYTCASQAI